MIKLKKFSKPDIEFNVVNYLSDKLNIEEGQDFIVLLDEDTDMQILDWASQMGIIDDFQDECGTIDLESLREHKNRTDLENYYDTPPLFASPNGRAFKWFSDLHVILPEGTSLVEGSHPGCDWTGVEVDDMKSLLNLQEFLFSKGYEVNFNLNLDEE